MYETGLENNFNCKMLWLGFQTTQPKINRCLKKQKKKNINTLTSRLINVVYMGKPLYVVLHNNGPSTGTVVNPSFAQQVENSCCY